MEKHDSVSVFLFSYFPPDRIKLLLLMHKKFNKWIVPGGHVEGNENQLEAAVREVHEETGITLQDKNFFSFNDQLIMPKVSGIKQIVLPLFIFEQEIPEHKGEAAHYHIDHVYCAYCRQDEIISELISENESQHMKWYSEEDIHNLDMFPSNFDVAKVLFNRLNIVNP